LKKIIGHGSNVGPMPTVVRQLINFFLDWGTSHWIANDCRTVHLCSIILTAELRALVCENCFKLITVVDVVVIVVAKIIYTSVAVGCSVSLMKINVNIR